MISIINEKTFEKARKRIKEEKSKKNIVCFASNDDELNRKILEKEKVDFFLPILSGKKDYSKQRNSSFNQVLAKIAKKKKIKIAINLNEILQSQGKTRAKIISRALQNIMLCKKNNLKMTVFGTNNKQDHLAVCLSLGMPTWMPIFTN